ncbi:hypothetical protein CRG98_005292 [Punica granatum]|uniref:Uncharacterized protein n=1 Tax=Punica granatum TaxID=22663 RepID=A0A2I0L2C7_PUNGR|nr:hypothetical protein CRG98_005292 [Punica granatum]
MKSRGKRKMLTKKVSLGGRMFETVGNPPMWYPTRLKYLKGIFDITGTVEVAGETTTTPPNGRRSLYLPPLVHSSPPPRVTRGLRLVGNFNLSLSLSLPYAFNLPACDPDSPLSTLRQFRGWVSSLRPASTNFAGTPRMRGDHPR